MNVFVFGATGQIGRTIVEQLLKAGHAVKAGSRNPADQAAHANLEWVFADAGQPGMGTEALNGVDAAFLMSPPFHTDQYAVLNPWIEAAKTAGVKKIVLMTALGMEHAPAEAPFRKLELALIDSGLNYSIIRPNWFMDNFHTFWIGGILEQKTLYFPAGEAQTSFIHSRDIAAAAYALLTSDAWNGREFPLTGRESLTHARVAELISLGTGLDIRFADISPEDFRASLTGAGVPEDYADLLVQLAAGLAAGHNSEISDAVRELAGREPIAFADYVEEFKPAWLPRATAKA